MLAAFIFALLCNGLHSVNFFVEFGFEVGGFVLMNNGTFGQFVDDRNHFGQAFGCHGFVVLTS